MSELKQLKSELALIEKAIKQAPYGSSANRIARRKRTELLDKIKRAKNDDKTEQAKLFEQ